jgi:alkaline phosphatase D
MGISRRRFLGALAASSAMSLVGGEALAHSRWTPRPEDLLPGNAFRHGVASGDPLKHRVILWTRVTPRSARQTIPVTCLVARDARMKQVIGKYRAFATAAADFTVKIDAFGLHPDCTYYYQFHALGEASPVGRTRTLPWNTDKVRLAVASCANLPAGFFGAYGLLAQQQDLNAVLHLGDYIYEYGNGEYTDGTAIGRIPEPNRETVTLDDYRTRYAQYRRDLHLQEAHRLHPWIVVWDDHETANDAWKDGAENHQHDEGEWSRRKAAAMRAWFEWLPVRNFFGRRQRFGRIFRRFRFGDLLQLDMLDTRMYGREQQVPALVDGVTSQLLVSPEELMVHLAELNRPDRQLLGARQEAWLFRQLERAAERRVQWNVLGQQVMMGQLSVTAEGLPPGVRLPLNTDQWDGYAGARARLLDMLAQQNIDNTLVLTGDFHSSWAHDIAQNPYDNNLYDPASGSGSQAVEFVTPAISSPFFVDPNPAQLKGLEQFAMSNNPHTHYVDLEHNGYMVVDVDRYRARAEYYHIHDVLNPDTGEFLAAAVETANGANHAVLVDGEVSSLQASPASIKVA